LNQAATQAKFLGDGVKGQVSQPTLHLAGPNPIPDDQDENYWVLSSLKGDIAAAFTA